jgi:hypothetical protein
MWITMCKDANGLHSSFSATVQPHESHYSKQLDGLERVMSFEG